MPSGFTIASSTFIDYVTNRVIEPSAVDAKHDAFRGNIIPVDASLSASADKSYYVGGPTARGKGVFGAPLYGQTAVTGDFTDTANDEVIFCSNASTAAYSITLPTAVSLSGKEIFIKRTDDTNTSVTIDGSGSETIGGSITTSLIGLGSMHLVSDGAIWKVASRRDDNIIYIKDEKSSGTAGGTFTSGAWRTRDLNLIDQSGDSASLSSNQFTLQAGNYIIKIKAPAFGVDSHKAKLRNITDSTDDIIGTSEYSDSSFLGRSHSFVEGRIRISSSKTFEVQHQCGTTRATSGLGKANSFSVNEVYTIDEIRRISNV